MLAGMRSCFLLSFLLVFSVVACLPAQAQINGVPASVTSLGFGGSNNPNPGVRASVTSLGPNGYGNSRPVFGNCCGNFFFPANQEQALFFGSQSSGHHFFGVIPAAVVPPRGLTTREVMARGLTNKE